MCILYVLAFMQQTHNVMRENTYNIIRQELCFSNIHSRNAATVLRQSVSSRGLMFGRQLQA